MGDPPPVLRVRTEPWASEPFLNLVERVRAGRHAVAPGFHRSLDRFPKLMVNSIAAVGGNAPGGYSGSRLLEMLWDAMMPSAKSDPQVSMLLYWVATAAESEFIRELDAKLLEEQGTTILVSKLRRAAERFGQPLFEQFGYDKKFPFHFVTFEITRKSESENGSDWGVLLDLTLEDRRIVTGALVQAKIAGREKAGIFRKNKKLGENHQLAALVMADVPGYYLFLDEDPAEGLPIAIAPAATIAQTLLTINAKRILTELNSRECNVDRVEGAVDFGTFFGFSLLNDQSNFGSMIEALNAMKGAESIARKLVIIHLGQSIGAETVRQLEALGYRQTREQPSLFDQDLARQVKQRQGRGFEID